MNYDRFASCYDEVMDDYSWCDHFIRSMIDTRITRRRAVLELGCGTGRILELAAPLFERSTGIDLSPAMLTHARERLPNSSFHLQDMRTFSLSEHFDLILCLYDTINHLTSFDQWQQCFSRMASHLAPGGLCIIDMNTPQRLGRLSLFPPTVRTVAADDTMIMEVSEDDGAAGQYHFTATIFEHSTEDLYRKQQIRIDEYAPEAQQVHAALSSLFDTVEIFDEDERPVGDDLPLKEAENGRLFFVCR
ncbi:MAG: class I SAM-dependent methyltransferase [Spirochaetia bacterium]|nr:class I SAM-dependent methyltransferase [Spirochaetia bacterium]